MLKFAVQSGRGRSRYYPFRGRQRGSTLPATVRSTTSKTTAVKAAKQSTRSSTTFLIRSEPIHVTNDLPNSSSTTLKPSTTSKPSLRYYEPENTKLIRPIIMARVQSRQRKPFSRISPVTTAGSAHTYKPLPVDYDYYDAASGNDDRFLLGRLPAHSKVVIHKSGEIQCLDQGNFPHPVSCRKFISCAKMETGSVLGWEYTCPNNLSFDPVGGICNWAAGLGCHY